MKTKEKPSQPSLDSVPSLNKRYQQWLACLYGDDPNSIGHQVYVLLDDLLSWWTINEARQFTPQDKDGVPKGSALLHVLLDRCFATSQMAAVRRLCDSSYLIDDEKRGVCSLNSLLGDLTKYAPLLTRQAILAIEGLDDDPQSLKREADQAVRNAVSAPQVRFTKYQNRNRDVDFLAGNTSNDRADDDQLRPEVFKALQDYLDTTCKNICDKVDKFFAHAATPESRKKLIDDSSQVTPNDLIQAAISIKDTFDLVTTMVITRPTSEGNNLTLGCMTIPAAELFNPLEYLDHPLILTQDIPRVKSRREEMKKRLSDHKDPRSFLESMGLC